MPTTQKPCLVSNSWTKNSTQAHIVHNWIVPGEKTGQSVQGWRKRIQDGSNAGSPYTLDRLYQVSESPAAGSISVEYVVWNGSSFVPVDTLSMAFNGYPQDLAAVGANFTFGHRAAISGSAEAEALTRVYDALRKEAYGANGLLVLGELRETIHMLKNPLESARKAVVNYLSTLKTLRQQVARLKRRKSDSDVGFRGRKLTAVKDGMSGTWLELQFGLKPLISDAKEILDATRQALTAEPKRQRLRCKSPAVRGDFQTTTSSQEYYCLTRITNFTVSSDASVMYVVGMKHSVDGPGTLVESMYERLGFQVQNFVPTIYELIPYSFLVDYFVNLGDIVSAVCTDTSSVAWISRTERRNTVTAVTEYLSAYHESWSTGTFHPKTLDGKTTAYRTYRHLTVNRTIPETLGIPPLVLSVPGIDSTKWVNMGALLASARDFRFRR